VAPAQQLHCSCLREDSAATRKQDPILASGSHGHDQMQLKTWQTHAVDLCCSLQHSMAESLCTWSRKYRNSSSNRTAADSVLTCFQVDAAPLEHGCAYLRALGVQHGGDVVRTLFINHLAAAVGSSCGWLKTGQTLVKHRSYTALAITQACAVHPHRSTTGQTLVTMVNPCTNP
jgi:hypothetical protein